MKKLLLTLIAGVAFASCSAPCSTQVAIVPYPNSVELGRGEFNIAGAVVSYDARVDERTQRALADLADQLSLTSGVQSALAAVESNPSEGIYFELVDTLPTESYTLEITKKGVVVGASQFAGFFYAIQSLKQLMPTAIFGSVSEPQAAWIVPCLKIEDAPRFEYRGMHLDVSRHFFSLEEVKRYIDVMAIHKLNKFHWHLTDDQGWRIEIKNHPRLTTVGGTRKASVVGKDWGRYDGVEHGGFYTQDQIREVVAYAADRAIEVIPEIDLPGHMQAALAAYPELGCTGGPYEVWGRWGVSDDVLCVGQEKTYKFLEDVLTEVVELFPSQIINIGGDECPKIRWESCPRCQAKIKSLGLKDKGHETAEHFLQSYVTTRIGKFLSERGRRLAGWDEILEGGAPSDAMILAWRGTDQGIAGAKRGHDVVMCPTSNFYFDYYQSLDMDTEPFGIGGYVPIERVYEYEPYVAELTPEEHKHILGVQANLWTEYIADNQHLEYMLLPRLAALSEVQWCQANVKDWNRFVNNFRMTEIYATMGYNFATHIFGVTGTFVADAVKGCVVVTLSTAAGADIYYTMDGSEPTAKSALYTTPIEIRESCTFKANTLRDDVEVRPFVRAFNFNKATARPITLNSAATPKYIFGGANLFVDGYFSSPVYANGSWVGFLAEPMDVTVDMGDKADYSSAGVNVMVQKGEEVLPPSAVEALVSDDGVNFTSVGKLAVEPEKERDLDGIRKYMVTFPQTKARYLRLVANTVNPIPYNNSGRQAHMFVDEIIVE